MTKALSCICCYKELDPVFPDQPDQPSRGTAFISYGHYGSTVFDPMDGSYLQINVCDSCLTNKVKYGIISHTTAGKNTTIWK